MQVKRSCVVLAALAVGLACAGAAQAHQTASNKGVSVTVHVTPNDEPLVGQTALILVPRVKPGKLGKFSWATCRCTLKVSDSALTVLRRGPALPRNEFVFPEAAAYRIDFAGRVRRSGKWVWFKVWFAIRAYEVVEENPLTKEQTK